MLLPVYSKYLEKFAKSRRIITELNIWKIATTSTDTKIFDRKELGNIEQRYKETFNNKLEDFRTYLLEHIEFYGNIKDIEEI
jgi:hypothetical protein